MNVARLSPNGPYVCGGDLAIVSVGETTRTWQASLCRCGASRRKPWCDGSHDNVRFHDAGLLPAGAAPGHDGPGRVTLTVQPDGPLEIDGPLTLASSDGRSASAAGRRLCRCGASATKPWCDDTHLRIGFRG